MENYWRHSKANKGSLYHFNKVFENYRIYNVKWGEKIAPKCFTTLDELMIEIYEAAYEDAKDNLELDIREEYYQQGFSDGEEDGYDRGYRNALTDEIDAANRKEKH